MSFESQESGLQDVGPRASRGGVVRALVVDDIKNIRATLALYLESLGCQVIAAGTSQRALDALKEGPFDVAFVDLRLGAESGLDLISRLVVLSPALKVVLITAFPGDSTVAEAARRGAHACLSKPFALGRIEDLLSSMASRPDEAFLAPP